MRINESVFRKILREEARRALNEATTGDTTGAVPAATPTPAGPVQGPQTAAQAGAADAAKQSAVVSAKKVQGIVQGFLSNLTPGPVGDPMRGPLSVAASRASALTNPDDRNAAAVGDAISKAIASAPKGQTERALAVLATLATGTAPTATNWLDYMRSLGLVSSRSPSDALLALTAESPSIKSNPTAKAIFDLVSPQAAALVANAQEAIKRVKAYQAAATNRGQPAITAAPTPGTAPAAAAPAKDWTDYISRVNNGKAVQDAWTEYITKVTPQGFNASFGSFVKYYNALVKQQGGKALLPDQMIKHLKDKVAAAAASAGLTPVTPITDFPVAPLQGGELQGVEANRAAVKASADQSFANLRAAGMQ